MPIPPSKNQKIDYIVTQFNALRDEIMALKDRVSKIIIATLSGIPIIVASGDQLKLELLIVAAPIITATAMFLVLSEQNGIMRAGRYIRKHLEPQMKTTGLIGWEEYLESENSYRKCEKYLLVVVILVFTSYYIGSSMLAYLTVKTKYGFQIAQILLFIYLSGTLFFIYFIIKNFQIRSSLQK